MGDVYRALHLGLEAPRAIKVLRSDQLDNEEIVRRFRNEALIAEGLRHPNVVALYDFGELPSGHWYIVSEYVEGESLFDLFKKGERFTAAESIALLVQAADALTEAHRQGITHRDVAPDNIMIVRDGDRKTVKILDFGIAKMTTGQTTHHTSTGLIMGKIGYAAPEQLGLLGDTSKVDQRTDVFALAVVAHQLLTGKHPFNADSMQSYVHNVLIRPEQDSRNELQSLLPEAMRGPITRALMRYPDQRTGSMDSFKAELLEALSRSTSISTEEGSFRLPAMVVDPADLPTMVGSPLEKHNPLPSSEPQPPSRPPPPPSPSSPSTVRRRDLPVATGQGRRNQKSASPWGWASLLLFLPVGALLAYLVSGRPSRSVPPPSVQAPESGDVEKPSIVADEGIAPREPLPRQEPLTAATPSDDEPAPHQPGPGSPDPRREEKGAIEPARPSVEAVSKPVRPDESRRVESPLPQPKEMVPPPEPAPVTAGELRIASEPNAEVRVDGTLYGETPIQLELEAGRHQVVLTTPSGFVWEKIVRLEPARTLSLSQRLDAFGSVAVHSDVWAEVHLEDGTSQQTPTFFARVLVGEHSLRVSRPGFKEQRIRVVVKEGETTNVRLRMERLEP